MGFRPFVLRLAHAHALTGTVCNAADGVHVVVSGDEQALTAFGKAIIGDAPPLARITYWEVKAIEDQVFDGFFILPSPERGSAEVLLSPDFALCEACRAEMSDPANRRFGYAFITCTTCGPRFSIATGLPYDRERTTMAPFVQCPVCQTEYDDPANRRYFSQTNSCPECGVKLLSDWETNPIEGCVQALREGKMVAVKGIGGYLLLCDATRAEVVAELRRRKHRPAKPLAVLYPHIAAAEGDTELSGEARKWLLSPEAPIVLVPLRPNPPSGLAADAIAPGLDTIGVMLPYAPLLEQIAAAFGKPLVATSANLSGSPIAWRDAQVRTYLHGIADHFLGHDRAIAAPQDDSVVRLSPIGNKRILLRRARGFAPTLLGTGLPAADGSLALGADLKAAFAWSRKGSCYVSPFLGDLESYDAQQQYRWMLSHFKKIFTERPLKIICDAHPGYFSHQLARELGESWGIPVETVFHHPAHFAAVLGEHGLRHQPGRVMGVVWDGAGYGADGRIQGGEFFVYENEGIRHMSGLVPYANLLGDRMAREPRISLLSLGREMPELLGPLEGKFTSLEWKTWSHLPPQIATSSMGRVFDAMASLLGLGDIHAYEGEAAMKLESIAIQWIKAQSLKQAYALFTGPLPALSPTHWIAEAWDRLRGGQTAGAVAAWFHLLLTEVVRAQAEASGVQKIAFGGGVFQNGLLTDLLQLRLGQEFDLFFPNELSPNDESIAYGQLIYSELSLRTSNQPEYVSGNSRKNPVH